MTWKGKVRDGIAMSIRPAHRAVTSFRRGPLLAPTDRQRFLAGIADGPGLEIGPFDAPLLHGAGVKYFDVLGQEALRSRSVTEGRDPSGCPPIDFVSPGGDLGVVDDEFDVVLSAHTIEHQPDLIGHLEGVSRLLRPGGRYFLVIPDRRFCFDPFLPGSTYDDVLAAVGHQVHTPLDVENHRLGTTHNKAFFHWVGRHGPQPPRPMNPAVAEECQRARGGEYIDVHAWLFTPDSFSAILRRLKDEGLIGLSVERVHATAFGTQEFFAVLRKDSD